MDIESDSEISQDLLSPLIELIRQLEVQNSEEALEEGEKSLEDQVLDELKKLFPLIPKEQQTAFGISPAFSSNHLFLLPQDLAKRVLECFAGNRFIMTKIPYFAIFGRLLKGWRSVHKFVLWPGDEQDSSSFTVEIKIPDIDGEACPLYLYFRNIRRVDLCSNRYYLYILRPKFPPATNQVNEDLEDLYLQSAIEMDICMRASETFKGIPDFQDMMNSNIQTGNAPEYLYTREECETIKQAILGAQRVNPNFKEDVNSNAPRNILLNLKAVNHSQRADQEPLSEQDSAPSDQESEEQGESIDSNGNHFLLGNVNAQDSENSFARSSNYEGPSWSATVSNQSLRSFATASTRPE